MITCFPLKVDSFVFPGYKLCQGESGSAGQSLLAWWCCGKVLGSLLYKYRFLLPDGLLKIHHSPKTVNWRVQMTRPGWICDFLLVATTSCMSGEQRGDGA